MGGKGLTFYSVQGISKLYRHNIRQKILDFFSPFLSLITKIRTSKDETCLVAFDFCEWRDVRTVHNTIYIRRNRSNVAPVGVWKKAKFLLDSHKKWFKISWVYYPFLWWMEKRKSRPFANCSHLKLYLDIIMRLLNNKFTYTLL